MEKTENRTSFETVLKKIRFHIIHGCLKFIIIKWEGGWNSAKTNLCKTYFSNIFFFFQITDKDHQLPRDCRGTCTHSKYIC